MSPCEALDLASAAINELRPDRHSFRLLGTWSDHREKEWVEVARYEHINMAAVYDELRACGARVRQFKSQDARGLIWRVESEQENNAILERCPTLSKGVTSSSQQKSDSGCAAPSDPWDFDRIPDDFDRPRRSRICHPRQGK